MSDTEQPAWYAVHVGSRDKPVALFEYGDQANRWADANYRDRAEIRPCAPPAPAPSHRPDTPNLNSLEPFLFTIEPGWYWVGTGVRIGDQDRMLVVQKATDADVARLQGESAPRGLQCEECKGTGQIESPFHGGGMDCPHCIGKGVRHVQCNRCGGSGWDGAVTCLDCKGTGQVPATVGDKQ